MGIPTQRIRYIRPTEEPLTGPTYKIQPPTFDEAVYVTINDADFDGHTRPIEMFINSKDTVKMRGIDVISRLVSATLQQPGEFPVFVIKELKESYDPEGSYFQGKVMINGVIAHIGLVLEDHCKRLGILDSEGRLVKK